MQSYGNKTVFFALVSLVANLAFAVMNGVTAAMYSSLWYGALAGYYTILIVFRSGVIIAQTVCRKKYSDNEYYREKADVKIYLGSGAFLVVLEIAMAVAVVQMVMTPKPAPTGQIVAIATAAYTFYTMTMAIINLVKARKTNDYVTQTLRNINLATACMAMLSLTVSLIATFGVDDDMFEVKVVAGVAVCAVTLALATYMIVKASKRLKNM